MANQGDVIELTFDDLLAIDGTKNEIAKAEVMYDSANAKMQQARDMLFVILRARYPELDGRSFVMNWKRNVVTVAHVINEGDELA